MPDKIQQDIEKALAAPAVRETFASFADEPFALSRGQFNRYIQAESARFAAVIENAGAALDWPRPARGTRFLIAVPDLPDLIEGTFNA